MAKIINIWSGNTGDGVINKSTVFTDCTFLIIETPGLEVNEGYELGGLVQIELPQGKKEIPVTGNIVSSNQAIILPRECTDFEYDCYFIFVTNGESINVNIYAYCLEVSLKTLDEDLKDIQNCCNLSVVLDSAIVANQIAQDLVISAAITEVGLLLAPFTGGASLALAATTLTPFATALPILLALPAGI